MFDYKELRAGNQHISIFTYLLKERVAAVIAVRIVLLRQKYNIGL